MKNNIILLMSFVTFLLMSCNTMLDLNPTDQLSLSTFWKTKADADMALTGVYSKLRLEIISAGGGGGTLAHWDGLTDNAYCTYPWEGGFTDLGKNITPSSGGALSSLYFGAYQGIALANDFLANANKINDTSFDAATKAKYIAEAKFIRVYWYYWLTQCFQDVPYADAPLTVETMKMPVTKKADIVAKLITDLNECISNLPDITYAASAGHVVKGSAQALKARIQLFNGDFAGAATTAKAVIDGGKFSLNKTGNTPYGDLFAGDLDQSSFPEIMFSTRFQYPNFVHRLEMQLNGWVSVTPRPEFASHYQNGDARKPQTIASFGEEFKIGTLWGAPKVNAQPGWTISGMTINKYSFKRPYANSDDNQEGTHIIHIRYAEVLLIYAEAKNQTSGPDASAYAAINEVRHRAQLQDLTAGLTKAQFQDSVLRERRYEFFVEEAMRYMDIKRYKLAGSLLPKVPYPPLQANATTGVIPSPSASTPMMNWDDKWYVWPIPQGEVDKDPTNLKQVNTDRGY
jgi:starch-binding outer membrane protein, SusD/RagB family